MLEGTISTLFFIGGFVLSVPAVPLALWLCGPQTEASLLLLMVSLPLYVWISAYVYLRAFNASEAVVKAAYCWTIGYLAEPSKPVHKLWTLQPQPVRIRSRR